ncbi:hypothetical protein E1B28_004167 [Marasmius oreades]|uniref:Uncharacterized protein n=1 Tax=Marasmius oreades TaxID=181124 RepID=A0A9P7UY52_9AGAR|nr:uncharacterized protein E1B28_004167 [Marasmius oreades]KAG7096755.1 hypothetical protein E1B28_004167 [Marasmius oreades]
MKIEWTSDAYFHHDGTRRKVPLPSVMHGWLAKMRGTLLGDEDLRTRGIREMRAAAKCQAFRKENEARRSRPSRSRGFFSIFRAAHRQRPRRSNTKLSRERPTLHRSNHSSRRAVGPAPRRDSQRRPPARKDTLRRGYSSRGHSGRGHGRPSIRR